MVAQSWTRLKRLNSSSNHLKTSNPSQPAGHVKAAPRPRPGPLQGSALLGSKVRGTAEKARRGASRAGEATKLQVGQALQGRQESQRLAACGHPGTPPGAGAQDPGPRRAACAPVTRLPGSPHNGQRFRTRERKEVPQYFCRTWRMNSSVPRRPEPHTAQAPGSTSLSFPTSLEAPRGGLARAG